MRTAYDAIMPINQRLSASCNCTAGYPPDFSELNLRVIETFRDCTSRDVVIGFSSHDNGIAMPLVAYMLGARIVEKHFTLNRTMKGATTPSRSSRSGLKQAGARPRPRSSRRSATA